MRSDFTAGFTTEKDAKANKPTNVLHLVWPEVLGNPAVTLYLSDISLTIGAQAYQPVVADWGDIDWLYDDFSFVEKSVGDVDIALLNAPVDYGSGAERFSKFLTRYPPEAATATLYQYWRDASLGAGDLAPLFKAEVQVPDGWGEKRIRLRLIQITQSYVRKQLGGKIGLGAYPNAPASAVGQPMPVVFGSVPRVPGRLVRKINKTSLSAAVIPGATSISVVSTDGFPSVGSLLLNDDTLAYSGKTSNTFTGVTGVNEIHYANDEVAEKVSDFRFLFSDPAFPIKAIDDVYVGNDKVTTGFSKNVGACEAVFTAQPRKVVSLDTKFLQAQFDAQASGNTAVNPLNAIDSNQGSYAQINQTNRTLALQQTTAMPSRGIISQVFLRIVHWSEEKLPNDNVTAQIRGLGSPFTLSPPGADEGAVVAGDTDIQHDTIDTFGFPLDNPQPPITPTTDADSVLEQPGIGAARNLNIFSPGGTAIITFPSAPSGAIKTVYRVSINVVSGVFGSVDPVFVLGSNPVAAWNGSRNNFDYTSEFEISGNPASSLTLLLNGNGGNWFIDLVSVTRFIYYPHNSAASQGSQNTVKSGGNLTTTGTKPLVSTTDKTTNTVTDLFDITSLVNGDWSWFQDKILDVIYNGSSDGRTVFVIKVDFEIEYTRRRLQVTDEVYADIQGVKDDGSGTITATPDALMRSPEHLYEWLARYVMGLDSGDIDSGSFTTAGVSFATAITGGYKFDGIHYGDETVQAVLSRWMFESRSTFRIDALGKATLRFRPLNESNAVDGQEVKSITQSMIRKPVGGEDSIKFSRTPSRNIVNSIQLNYNRVWGEEEYASNVSGQDGDSISIYGLRDKHPEVDFDFILCRLDDQANDLLIFWLKQLGQPSVIIDGEVFLDQMELEPGDIVKFTHEVDDLSDIFAEVLPGGHVLGSGTARRMDSIELKLRLFPVSFIQLSVPETVEVTEVVTLLAAWLRTLTETVKVTEVVAAHPSLGAIAETVDVTEAVAAHPSVVVAEAVDVTEAIILHPDLAAYATVNVTEEVFSSVNGWGEGGWGQFPWGDRQRI